MGTAEARPTSDARPAFRLSVLAGALAALAAILGLLLDDAYTVTRSTAAMLRGYDLVTLVVALPLLAWAVTAVRRGSVRGLLVWTGMLAYLAYTYPYYLVGAGLATLTVLHVGVIVAAALGLLVLLVDADLSAVATRFRATTPVRAISAVLGVLAVALGGMWVAALVGYALTGEVPAGSVLVETDTVVFLGIALDLVLLVPLYGVAAVLLWRRRPWGFVLAAVALVVGTLHQVSYLVALVFQAATEVPGAVAFDPFEPVILLMYAVATVLLLRGVSAPTGRRTPAGSSGSVST